MEVKLRVREREKPQKTQAAPFAQGVAQLQKNRQPVLPLGRLSAGRMSNFFLFSPLKIAIVPPGLQNTEFLFHDKKLRVCACICWRGEINT